MNHLEKLMRGMQILLAFGYVEASFEHDEVFVQEDYDKKPRKMLAGDIEELKSLGWRYNEDIENWSHF